MIKNTILSIMIHTLMLIIMLTVNTFISTRVFII
jgi:hypothetical protein